MSLLDSARVTVNTCLKIKKGETVLIVTDTNKHSIANAFYTAAQEAGSEAIFLEMPERDYHGEEPPRAVAKAMTCADVIIAPTTYSITHTFARRKATERGARIVTLPGITVGMMNSGALKADFSSIAKEIIRVSNNLKGTQEINITTKEGTDLKFSVRGRKWITEDTGLAHKKNCHKPFIQRKMCLLKHSRGCEICLTFTLLALVNFAVVTNESVGVVRATMFALKTILPTKLFDNIATLRFCPIKFIKLWKTQANL